MHSGIKSVRFYEGLKEIGDRVLFRTDIEAVGLPNSLEKLGIWAFSSSSLKELRLGRGITVIPFGAFASCEIEQVDIPSNVQIIGWYAFLSNPLKSVTLHEGLQQIGEQAFSGCKLVSIKLPPNVEAMRIADENVEIIRSEATQSQGSIGVEKVEENPSLEDLKKEKEEMNAMLVMANKRLQAREQDRGSSMEK